LLVSSALYPLTRHDSTLLAAASISSRLNSIDHHWAVVNAILNQSWIHGGYPKNKNPSAILKRKELLLPPR